MRKNVSRHGLKPLAVAITAALYGCSSHEEVVFVKSVEDCQYKTKRSLQECEAAYQKAILEAERTGPKYKRREDCEAEFGYNQCTSRSNGFFMPFITGYLVSSVLHRSDYYHHPVYTYSGGRHQGRVIMSDGTIVGRKGAARYSLPKDSLKSKPTVTKTVSRGGFGSVASAKSNWGGGGSSRSWGG